MLDDTNLMWLLVGIVTGMAPTFFILCVLKTRDGSSLCGRIFCCHESLSEEETGLTQAEQVGGGQYGTSGASSDLPMEMAKRGGVAEGSRPPSVTAGGQGPRPTRASAARGGRGGSGDGQLTHGAVTMMITPRLSVLTESSEPPLPPPGPRLAVKDRGSGQGEGGVLSPRSDTSSDYHTASSHSSLSFQTASSTPSDGTPTLDSDVTPTPSVDVTP
ncbi:uncharacterized protein LOC143299856 [Babylonia areolata]|uniref:uncharacterized protein LOC143299856 n=1 Tax=Babylonia areolata TaxID=304850 RepID=UPI003FD3582D